jgi:4-alpha-glucanotransferase
MKKVKKSEATTPLEKQQKKNISERGAGVLFHITSLPGNFGIGDMGREAKQFCDFLNHSKQKYWQLLPLNPVDESQHYAPYSSTSSLAGNALLISPEVLVNDNLLKKEDIEKFKLPNTTRIPYRAIYENKEAILEKSYYYFCHQASKDITQQFEKFIQQENYWLNDFACYVMLKKLHHKPWSQWPPSYKFREAKALQQLEDHYQDELKKVKWFQFLFSKQWKQLKAYSNQKGIQLFGDLPFYVSYDSADVWSNQDIFCLDKKGNMISVAGVPPDYFNEDGQLWGMPIFNWEEMKRQRYRWWIKRFRKNMEMFDLIRLDHFRAFVEYWEVAATEKTAKKGSWNPGPGAHIFEAIKKELGSLPFVAEDLGDIDDTVYELRDRFNFPGMKVLQFAFSDNMAKSDHIPHNYSPNFIVYTGTHDNNTTVGWYCKDMDGKEGKNISDYLGKPLHEKNIHRELIRLAYSSVAKIAIIPLQDILGLDESCRMNKPASTNGNWEWRLMPQQLSSDVIVELKKLVEMFNRI